MMTAKDLLEAIESRETARAAALCASSGLALPQVHGMLAPWIRSGEIACLIPVSTVECDIRDIDPEQVFYRLCREDENQYQRQHLYMEGASRWKDDPYKRNDCFPKPTTRRMNMKNPISKMMQRIASLALPVLMAAGIQTANADEAIKIDENLPVYAKTEGVSGNINSIGSDTLNNLMALWTEGFRAVYPNVNIQVEGKGSSTAPPALIENTAQLGPMSREMKSKEIDAFEAKYGYKPTPIKVAVDALAVFVHKDNPIEGMTLTDVDGVFSSTRKFGGDDITKWGQLGLSGDWDNRPISLYGRNSASGTYGYFKSVALKKGDYRPTVKEQPGSSSVVTGIANDLYAIGYSGIGYLTAGVRALPLGVEDGEYYAPNVDNAMSGDYPLARFLYIYVNKAPNQPLDKLTAEFLKFVLSKEGQEIVVKDGYFPLPSVISDEETGKLQ